MKYQVVWLPRAINRLARAYLMARRDERANELTAAAAIADRKLELDPVAHSESRSGRSRILTELPLVLYFIVDEVDQTVYVEHAFYIRRGRSPNE